MKFNTFFGLFLLFSNVFSATIQMLYQPMQCKETPWMAFYNSGAVKFKTPPSEQMLIKVYLAYKGITISSSKKVKGGAGCLACNVCPLGHYWVINLDSQFMSKMVELGFTVKKQLIGSAA
jgi:hypothetical protein